MSINLLEHIQDVEDFRVPGMVKYPLNEILLTAFTAVLCGSEDFEEIELFGNEQIEWLCEILAFESGIPQAQTFRQIFRSLDPISLESAFSSWFSHLQEYISGIAIDGKTLCGSKNKTDGSDALHVVSAYAHEAGVVLGQCKVDTKSNEITAIPELLDMLAFSGAIVTLDAMGAQKEIAAKIVNGNGDYVLSLKGNQGSLHEDVQTFFDDSEMSSECLKDVDPTFGHGRIEERTCYVADAKSWLAERHPEWSGLNTLAQITATRTDKKTGQVSIETRFYISSLSPDPRVILDASRSHWSIENNLHWQLDVTFREDACRTRKDHAPMNFAVIRRAAFNALKRDRSSLSLKRKRLKAAMNPDFRRHLLAC